MNGNSLFEDQSIFRSEIFVTIPIGGVAFQVFSGQADWFYIQSMPSALQMDLNRSNSYAICEVGETLQGEVGKGQIRSIHLKNGTGAPVLVRILIGNGYRQVVNRALLELAQDSLEAINPPREIQTPGHLVLSNAVQTWTQVYGITIVNISDKTIYVNGVELPPAQEIDWSCNGRMDAIDSIEVDTQTHPDGPGSARVVWLDDGSN